MASTYYPDESGFTGDVARVDAEFAFDDQPIFVLACVGEDDCAGLAEEVERLKDNHAVRLPELKASKLTGKPEFSNDLAALLRARARGSSSRRSRSDIWSRPTWSASS